MHAALQGKDAQGGDSLDGFAKPGVIRQEDRVTRHQHAYRVDLKWEQWRTPLNRSAGIEHETNRWLEKDQQAFP